VKALGKRIKDAGFKLMLDFHYSDTWADPAKQWTPKQWENLSDTELYEKIYDYTKDVLQQMKDAGAEPEFIQTGNEISYGMLWGKEGSSNLKKCFMGNDANWDRFTTLLSQAGKACREVCPLAKIILHTERTTQPNVLTNFYDKIKTANVDYDIIGLSYYPIWHNTLATLETTLNTLEARYTDKDIMIVETGAAYSWLPGDKDYTPSYEASEAGQKQFTDDLITMLNKHDKVTGLFWWWMDYNAYPQATTQMNADWWYAPLINSNTGKPLAAMSSLKNFLNGSTGIRNTVSDNSNDEGQWFTISGQPAGQNPNKPGLYIRNGKKIIVGRK
ncbi:MAG: glycosyl hydrolase 53 family protein, partial [Prevotellaceae bacterium]|nr:glycosyl hydrolase 53 family protein [Prevotellaceae bacterium]